MLDPMKTRRLTDDEIDAMREQCRQRDNRRDHALIVAGVHTGYRISELLWWDVTDVLCADGEWRESVTVPAAEMKDGDQRTVPLNREVRKVVGGATSRLATPTSTNRSSDRSVVGG